MARFGGARSVCEEGIPDGNILALLGSARNQVAAKSNSKSTAGGPTVFVEGRINMTVGNENVLTPSATFLVIP